MSMIDDFTYASALAYRNMGWSIIPVGRDKKPLIRWQDFQQRIATEDEVSGWWKTWPKAGIGIVTGAISGLTVVDIDTPEGRKNLDMYIPSSIKTVAARTQKGGTHLYFKFYKDIGNRVGVIPGTDLRSEGGYVVAPPTTGLNGIYEWILGRAPGQVPLADLPEAYVKVVMDPTAKILRTDFGTVQAFAEGQRNDTLFHGVLAMAKGGITDPNELYSYGAGLNASMKPPLDDQEVRTTVKSALEHLSRKHRNVAQEVRDWVMIQATGEFNLKTIYSELDIGTVDDKSLVRQVLRRMVEAGEIAKHPREDGRWRKKDDEVELMDIMGAPIDALDVTLPLDLGTQCQLYPGNIVVFAGEQNAGKTSTMIEVVRTNMDRWPIAYFTSEMGPTEFKVRLMLYEDMPLSDWKFEAYERSFDFADVIKPGYLNIVDYLEVGDEPWRAGKFLAEIHEAMKGQERSICFVGLQKSPGKEYGRGRDWSAEKPRLYVTLSRAMDMSGGIARIVKAKAWAKGLVSNPNGKILPFKIVNSNKFIHDSQWRYPEDEEEMNRALGHMTKPKFNHPRKQQ